MGDIETASFRSGSDGGTVHRASTRSIRAYGHASLVRTSNEKSPPERDFHLKPTRGLEPRTPSLRVKCSTS